MKRQTGGFTLIELLTVIAIFSILAALIFPVFNAARERGRMAVCQSNLKQLGTAFELYLHDWDETYPLPYTDRDQGTDGSTGNDYGRPTWKKRILPYLRTSAVYLCPSNDAIDRILNIDHYSGSESEKYIWEIGGGSTYAMNENQFSANVNNAQGGQLYIPPVSAGDLKTPDQVILVAEVQVTGPIIMADGILWGNWRKPDDPYVKDLPPYGSMLFNHYKNSRTNWLFCDGSVRMMRIKDTLVPKNKWIDPDSRAWPGEHYPEVFQSRCDGMAANLPPAWR